MCSIAAKILAGEEVGDGSDLGIKGYESVKLSKGANKCLIGQADIEITADNIDNYDF
jgi:simple sugar transport system substrate-binding protein